MGKGGGEGEGVERTGTTLDPSQKAKKPVLVPGEAPTRPTKRSCALKKGLQTKTFGGAGPGGGAVIRSKNRRSKSKTKAAVGGGATTTTTTTTATAAARAWPRTGDLKMRIRALGRYARDVAEGPGGLYKHCSCRACQSGAARRRRCLRTS